MASESLFTIVLDYAGGTYISQVRASSPAGAVSEWASRTSDANLAAWGLTREVLLEMAAGDPPTPVNGLRDVWCTSGAASRGLALVNIISSERLR
jgi:hypothetical protein